MPRLSSGGILSTLASPAIFAPSASSLRPPGMCTIRCRRTRETRTFLLAQLVRTVEQFIRSSNIRGSAHPGSHPPRERRENRACL